MTHPSSLPSLFRSIWINRQLIRQMTKREILGRYKGSILGLLWSLLNPILMLTVYTFVFSVVFKARWGEDNSDGKTQFAIILFAGIIVHGVFAEMINKAPNLVVENVNFVKRVIFPLEILPIISMGAALFHVAISLTVLLVIQLIDVGYWHWTIVLFPIVLLPLVIFTLGIGWILASIGVFIRDIAQATGIITTIILFLSPVFFPVKALPPQFQAWILLNPLTFIIENSRNVLIYGRPPSFLGLALYTLGAIGVAWLGYMWFQKTRKGFADVL